MSDLAHALLYGAILVPIAILGLAARLRRVRASRDQPTGLPGAVHSTDWARYDVPTFIRRRTGGTDQ